MAEIELVHDVLDMQLVDRNGEKMGRVDGITIELRDGQPPRVVELLVGGTVLADRVGSWMVWLLRGLGALARVKPVVTRLPFEVVHAVSDTIELDVDAKSTTAMRTEQWFDKLVCAIPGASGSKGGQE
ncbi:MAG TPA: PRC-barrel domain-containing protein [Gemmatimonadaceae bacterium]|nr:PRC-barrel domain-containing protein [Gemmatimonadaceae bacterium]